MIERGTEVKKDYRSATIFMDWLHDNSEAFPTLEFEDKAYRFKFKNTFPGLSFYVRIPAKSSTCSEVIRPPVPKEIVHLFRSKPSTESERSDGGFLLLLRIISFGQV